LTPRLGHQFGGQLDAALDEPGGELVDVVEDEAEDVRALGGGRDGGGDRGVAALGRPTTA
jgi:hypothetical protein